MNRKIYSVRKSLNLRSKMKKTAGVVESLNKKRVRSPESAETAIGMYLLFFRLSYIFEHIILKTRF